MRQLIARIPVPTFEIAPHYYSVSCEQEVYSPLPTVKFRAVFEQ